jgi:hypothetical protein
VPVRVQARKGAQAREGHQYESIYRADFEETSPLVVLMLFDVYHARRLFFFSLIKSTAMVAILGCILL